MPKTFKCSPPTDKNSMSGLEFLSSAITLETNLSPEGSAVNINIFLDKSKCIKLANKKKMFICAI